MVRKITSVISGMLRGKTICRAGRSFKPNTYDLREAPSLAMIAAIQDKGGNVRAFDPAAIGQAKLLMPKVVFCESPYHCAERARCAG